MSPDCTPYSPSPHPGHDAIRGRQVLVCQNRTCRKQGSQNVLAVLQGSSLPPDTTVVGCGCLGQCGNGPMVLVVPDQVWYGGMHPKEVPALVECHLWQGKPLRRLLYPKFHPSGQ